MRIHQVGAEAHKINADNGWDVFTVEDWPFPSRDQKETVRFLCTHMALVHTEVSEATEAIRHRDRENFDEELADIIIRVASIAWGLGTDLELAIVKKMEKNRSRGLHHGGKAV